MPQFVNLQRKVPLKVSDFKEFASQASSINAAKERDFSVAFVSDRRMSKLNHFFRGINATTDVLSFPNEPDEFVRSVSFSASDEERTKARTLNKDFLGDIVISVERAARQAEENGLTLENEIKQLILHGLLHLCGYDHETDNGEMNARELKLREELGI